jgi:sarcosine oxidase subunit beta
MLLRFPGVVVLHEHVLHHLISWMSWDHGDARTYLNEFRYCYGAEGEALARRIIMGQANVNFFDYPLADRVMQTARGLLVHSDYVRQAVLRVRPEAPLHVVPMGIPLPPPLAQRREGARQRLGINAEALVVASFGHINPFKAVDAYGKAARRLGVEINTGVEVTGIRVVDGHIAGVETTKGNIDAPVVVNAAGPYSKLIGRMAGVELPVYSERHQILVTEPCAPLQDPMVMSFSRSFYVQQSPHGSFIMGVGDPNEPRDAYETGHTWQFLEHMAKSIAFHLPLVGNLRIVRQWAGMYNLTPDRQPILGPVDGLDGYHQAIGFSGHGFMLGPVTGQLIAQEILDLPLSMPISQLHLNRIAAGNLILEPSVV